MFGVNMLHLVSEKTFKSVGVDYLEKASSLKSTLSRGVWFCATYP